jgi:hypothetical protein
MLFWIIQQIIISVVLIISVHYIYVFFKQNLTVPKTKDLVKRPAEQYKKIYTSLKKDEENKDNMKDELKNYLKQLTKKKDKKVEKENFVQAGNVFSSTNFTNF